VNRSLYSKFRNQLAKRAFDELALSLASLDHHIKVLPLSVWIKPDDTGIPYQLLDRPLESILSCSAETILAERGVGDRKFQRLLELLERVRLSVQSSSTSTSAGFNEAAPTIVPLSTGGSNRAATVDRDHWPDGVQETSLMANGRETLATTNSNHRHHVEILQSGNQGLHLANSSAPQKLDSPGTTFSQSNAKPPSIAFQMLFHPGGRISDAGSLYDLVMHLAPPSDQEFERWLNILKSAGVANLPAGVFCESLRELPRSLWHITLADLLAAVAVPDNDRVDLVNAGDRILEILYSLVRFLEQIDFGSSAIAIVPRSRNIWRVESWVPKACQGVVHASRGALADDVFAPLFAQLSLDTLTNAVQVSAVFCGLTTIRSKSVQEIAGLLEKSPSRIFQGLDDARAVFALRWPEGSWLLQCLEQTCQRNPSADTFGASWINLLRKTFYSIDTPREMLGHLVSLPLIDVPFPFLENKKRDP
jgi:hypothetical protein